MLKAGIDIGTNTILLLIAEVEAGQIVRVVEDHVRVVRLGQAVDKNRVLHPDAKDRARACFKEYADILKNYAGISINAVATSGSRDAKDAVEFFGEITKSFAIPIRVISGEEEASYSFKGTLENADPETVAVLDIGGGSTEIVGSQNAKLFKVSFDMGCVRLTERYLPSDPPAALEMVELQKFVKAQLESQKELLLKVKTKPRFLGVAGTPVYLAAAALNLTKFEPAKIHGYRLELSVLCALRKRLALMKAKDRIGVGGMDTGRADVIVSGALILEEVLKAAQKESIEVSVRGLRYGLVLV